MIDDLTQAFAPAAPTTTTTDDILQICRYDCSHCTGGEHSADRASHHAMLYSLRVRNTNEKKTQSTNVRGEVGLARCENLNQSNEMKIKFIIRQRIKITTMCRKFHLKCYLKLDFEKWGRIMGSGAKSAEGQRRSP